MLAVLHDQVDIILAGEVLHEGDDVGVFETLEQFYLPPDVLVQLGVVGLGNGNHLDGHLFRVGQVFHVLESALGGHLLAHEHTALDALPELLQ